MLDPAYKKELQELDRLFKSGDNIDDAEELLEMLPELISTVLRLDKELKEANRG